MRARRRVTLALTQHPENPRLLEKLRQLEENIKQSHRLELSKKENAAVETIASNPKYFFSYAKQNGTIRSDIGPLEKTDKSLTSDQSEMADILSLQYSSVFSKPKEPLQSSDVIFSDNAELSDFEFGCKDFENAINELSSNSATGPDNFPAILLKKCKLALIPSLMVIWRSSLDQGFIDPLMKTAYITPIHKGGGKTVPKNYRPIALTSHLIKVFEKLVRNHVVKHLETNNLMNPNQHGFRSGRSCLSQLLEHQENIVNELVAGNDVDVVYLDFSKAFDKVDHSVVLKKMSKLKIGGRVGKWLYSFLTGRTQTVVISGSKSATAPVVSGVPQGTVLGPIIFLILISDIDQDVREAFISSFADDTRVGRAVKNAQDAQSLQCALNAIYKWADENNMSFNEDKFEALHYGTGIKPEDICVYDTSSGLPINRKDTVKDLGVRIDANGGFKSHIEATVDKAKKLSAWILRTFSSRDSWTMMTLWKALVLPILDYCSQLWSPLEMGRIQELEQLQKSFTRRIDGVSNLNYWQRLENLRLYSLERRRERYIILYVYKILEGIAPNGPKIQSYTNARRGRLVHIDDFKSLPNKKVQKLRDSRFAVRAARLFNCLPVGVRNASGLSVDKFKKMVDTWLAEIPDQPQSAGYRNERGSNSLLFY